MAKKSFIAGRRKKGGNQDFVGQAKKKSSRQKKVMSRPAGAKNILERGMVGRGKVLQMGPKVKCGWWVNSS